jgi:2-methylisocitrate lyase-like PEP mutase family enzyme
MSALARNGAAKMRAASSSASDLPVAADLENGYGAAPEDCAETIARAAEVGLVGGSIEDATGAAGRADLRVHAWRCERIAAAVEAARALPFLLTFVARAENYLHGRADLDDTIRRLQAFETAGADVLYAPGLPSLEAIRTVCAVGEQARQRCAWGPRTRPIRSTSWRMPA